MNRRDFLTAVGLTAAAVAIGGIPLAAAGDAALTETFHVGDVLTITGCYVQHPITGQPVEGVLQRFIVTAVTDGKVILHPSAETLRWLAQGARDFGWNAHA